MEGFIAKIEKHLVPIAGKLSAQRHLAALKEGFIAIMPLMIIGAFAVMINSVFLDYSDGSLIGSFLENPISPENYPPLVIFLKDIMDFISKGSLNVVGILAAGTISYSLTKFKGYNGLEAAVLAIAAFFITFSYGEDASIAGNFFGSANLISAILVAFFVAEVYTWFLSRDIRIKMPDTVPPAVERSFSALVPATVIFVVLATFQTMLQTWEVVPTFGVDGLVWTTGSISLFIQNVIGLPLHMVAGGVFGALFYTVGVSFLWFFGIHGPNTLAFLDQAVFTPAAIQNATLIQEGIINYSGIIDQAAYSALPATQQANVISKSLIDSFVFIGGSGATIGLVIAIILGSRDEGARKVGKYAFAPALFNINEPLLFGLPIVFNPLLFIPFVIIQPILLILSLIVINVGLVPMYAIPIPWTSPVGLGAFLAYGGSITAMLWAFVCVAISTIIYYPFVVAMNRAKTKEEAQGE